MDASTGNSDDAPEDSRTHSIESSITGGRRFSVFGWSVSGSTRFEETGGEFRSRRQTLTGFGSYRWNRFLTQLATVGYEDISDKGVSDDDNVSGVFWSAGVRVTPSPRSSFRLEYGERFDSKDFSGDFSYDISPQTSISGAYVVDIETQQSAIGNNLQNLTFDEEGNLIDAVTGLPVDLSDLDTDLVDRSFKSETFRAGLNGTRGRNRFSLSGSYTRREFGAADGDEGTDKTTTVRGSFGRSLSPRSTLNLSGSYSMSNDSASDEDEWTARATAGFSYSFSNSLTGSLTYNLLKRDGDDDDVELLENAVSVRLAKTF